MKHIKFNKKKPYIVISRTLFNWILIVPMVFMVVGMVIVFIMGAS